LSAGKFDSLPLKAVKRNELVDISLTVKNRKIRGKRETKENAHGLVIVRMWGEMKKQ